MRLQDALQPTAAARHPETGVRVERWHYPGQQPRYTIRDLSHRGRSFRIEELPEEGWECEHACEHGKLDWFVREGNVIHSSHGSEVFEDNRAAIMEAWRLQSHGYCHCKWDWWDRYKREGE